MVVVVAVVAAAVAAVVVEAKKYDKQQPFEESAQIDLEVFR